MNHQKKIHQFNYAHFGKINHTQHIVVVVIGHYVACVGLNGTVHKFIVIRVCCDKVEVVVRCEEKHVIALHNSIEHQFCCFASGEPMENFIIFLQNFVGDTKYVLSIKNGQSHFMKHTSWDNALN